MGFIVAVAVMGGVLYLAYWIKGEVRRITLKRELQRQECEKIGHDIFRTYAYGDPRWPVDKCRNCSWQHHPRFMCPHCGVEIKYSIQKGGARGS